MAENKMISSVEDNKVLVLERLYDAPRDLLFRLFRDPELLATWWGPDGWETTIPQYEFKPGGVWHYKMTCVDPSQEDFYGEEAWGKAVFREIMEPEKVIYTDYFSDAAGKIDESLPAAEVVMEFIDLDGKTKLVSRSTFESAEDLQTIMDMGTIEGIDQTWNRLNTLAASMMK